MYKATIGDKTFDVVPDQINWDLVEYAPNCFHIIHNNKSYRAEIVKSDAATKTFVIKINGSVQTVVLKDKFDLLLEKMGMNASNASKINNIKAPMPGLIIDLKIKAGDTVNAGDALLILEAMKMENILKSPGGGVVKSIKVRKGDSVEKGQVLIEF
jgi:biotin carboxyl carrier protein